MYDSHDGFQLGSKYFFFPSRAGEAPEKVNFEEASSECVTAGGQLAYPSDDAENQAIMDYLSDHFDGDLSSGPNLVNP